MGHAVEYYLTHNLSTRPSEHSILRQIFKFRAVSSLRVHVTLKGTQTELGIISALPYNLEAEGGVYGTVPSSPPPPPPPPSRIS